VRGPTQASQDAALRIGCLRIHHEFRSAFLKPARFAK
jgi:hypothetical protein